MQKSTPKNSFSVMRLFCAVFGCRFKITRRVTSHINEYECIHCKKQGTTDVKGNIASMTPQLREINETLAHLYKKKSAVA